MQEKIQVSDFQFKQFLRALLGDKEDEVLDSKTKVEKAIKAAAPFRQGVKGVKNELLLDAMRVVNLGFTSGFVILVRLKIMPNGADLWVVSTRSLKLILVFEAL